ncbi:hypothetical protein Bca52824_001634 [Brassica carinata]|uniref:Uncharacterized protein n=1 Tax=Brassica carinata TaxID=52824 RepID=A0A8X7WIP7_BRACI|nr:hypothetical protein Bca52824_001634 [Brassica carinata]
MVCRCSMSLSMAPTDRGRDGARKKPSSIRCSSGNEDTAPSPSVVMDSDFDAKTFRKNLTRSDNYNRKGFGHKEETLKLMNREHASNFGSFVGCSVFESLGF